MRVEGDEKREAEKKREAKRKGDKCSDVGVESNYSK